MGAEDQNNGAGKGRYRGELELTWTNKDQRLLAHDGCFYEWVEPADYRVAEVRLLNDAGAVGKTTGGPSSRGKDNLLIQGDALNALTSLNELPEFASEYVGKVKLAYLDPPFNTGQIFENYDDALEHSVWLTLMRDRLLKIKNLLSRDGSVWVHLDDREAHRCRCVLDEVFGMDCFVGEVIWEMTDARKMDSKQFSLAHNRLLVYSRNPNWEPNRHEAEVDEKDYPHETDDGRRYSRRELRKWGKNSLRKDRPKLFYPLTAPDGTEVYPIRPDGKEGCWRWQQSKVEEEEHRIEWVETERGIEPYVMSFMDQGKKPLPPRSLWTTEFMPGNPAARKHLKELFADSSNDDKLFETPKPEELLEEILFLSSGAGDVVLDCFLGSGTTAAVAHKMGRHWVGVEWQRDTVETYIAPRLTKVVEGKDAGGITESAEFKGGGGFRILEVGESMFAEEDGLVTLADWSTKERLAEATAAQLGFEFEPDGPFCGRKGRTRLAVIDGLVNEDVVDLIAKELGEKERLMIAGTAVDPAATERLRELGVGSRVRKIPSSILSEYQQEVRWRPLASTSAA